MGSEAVSESDRYVLKKFPELVSFIFITLFGKFSNYSAILVLFYQCHSFTKAAYRP